MDRNTILAFALAGAVLIGWQIFVLGPQQAAYETAQRATAEKLAADQKETAGVSSSVEGGANGGTTPGSPQSFAPSAAQVANGMAPTSSASGAPISIDAALERAPGRIPINTPELVGSINLAGGRIDDLRLKKYRETIDAESPQIRFLSPLESDHGHYIEQGWVAAGDVGEGAIWSANASAALTPASPVTLTRKLGNLTFERTISVDEQFMFEVKDVVRNTGSEPTSVVPWAIVIQRNIPEDFRDFLILHEGPMTVVDGKKFERKYKKARTALVEETGREGWVGITNKYWLAAVIPPQGQTFKSELSNVGTLEAPIFRASYTMDALSVPAGGEIDLETHVFGGAKRVDILQGYEQPIDDGGLGVRDFDKAIDWGNFFVLTRPIFYTLNFFGDLTGNFGIAILLLTLVIKAILFPLANKAYESMSKMKKLQPKIEEMKTRFGDDKMKMQQEMMALYQKEKLNPLAGCVPILIQMPIFYALYKTLFVTIELRHEPFVGWIRDLSSPDPTSIFNLFGLLPYDPLALPVLGSFLGIGVLPLLMGVSMWFQMKLNPPATDPIQQQIFTLMPIMFTFLFAGFAAGLVLYWFWNTALSIVQQWYIMKRNGVTIDWSERLPFLKSSAAAKPAPGGDK
ncbi:MAG: membrane protein insertase YidC [Pseudomonadota bacterium]